jgi:hypothetical protein
MHLRCKTRRYGIGINGFEFNRSLQPLQPRPIAPAASAEVAAPALAPAGPGFG